MEKLDFSTMFMEEDNELLQKMKEQYLECSAAVKYCKQLGIPDEKIDKYITRIFDFVCDINYCKKCPGIKNCKKENPLLISKIDYHGNTVETQLTPCKELIKRVAFERQFKVRDFKDDWLESSLRDADKNAGRRQAGLLYASYLKGESTPWIYLTGNGGSGKSFFAATLTVDAASKGLGPVYFLNSAKRVRELADLSYNKKATAEFQDLLDEYSNARILVLDDFGNEFITDYIRDSILFPILANRNSKGLLTIFTSDFSIDEIETLYSTSKAGQIRAKQICKMIKANAKKEIDLSTPAIY